MVYPRKSKSQKFRLVTRSDLNGMACLALMKMMDIIDDVAFTHHRDIENRQFPISGKDIIANLPYNEKANLAFNYYAPGTIQRKQIVDYSAASTARVIYNYYGGSKKIPEFPEDFLRAVDKAALAQYPIEDVLQPDGWDLLSFILDHRTGLERHTEFKESNEALIRQIADEIGSVSIQDIFEWPNVKDRVTVYREQEPIFKKQIRDNFEINNNLITVDLRDESTVCAGNRFIVYALFPRVSISMFILKDKHNQTYEISVGKSIFSRTSTLHIGRLLEKYGGGGHANAGACLFDEKSVEDGIKDLTAKITSTKTWEWQT